MRALYIHWPFCKKKCPYCDFNSHVREQIDQPLWREALLQELRYYAAQLSPQPLGSIFFGGGTPSLMPPATAAALIEEAIRLFGAKEDIEITLEANPTSVEATTFSDFKAAGINRVSLGIQSLRDDSLAFLGREHSAHEALRALERANQVFARTNFDLIYALPDHSEAVWERELREALAYARGHLSLYQLTIEENTAFYHRYHHQRAFQLPEEDRAAALYELTQSVMEAAGMPAYEISNHARAGEASRHNLTYWRGGEYIGIGAGAHGRLYTAQNGWVATAHLKSPERWCEQVLQQGHGQETHTPLTASERAEERLLTGLRLSEGFALARLTPEERDCLSTALSPARLAPLVREGLLQVEEDRFQLTPSGRLLLNKIVEHLLT